MFVMKYFTFFSQTDTPLLTSLLLLIKEFAKCLYKNSSFCYTHKEFLASENRLKPNDPYMGRTEPLTSKHCILYIYSTNIGTEYFKHALYSPLSFSFQNAVCFIMLTCLFPYYSHFTHRMC